MITCNNLKSRTICAAMLLFVTVQVQAQSENRTKLFEADTAKIKIEGMFNNFYSNELPASKEIFHFKNNHDGIYLKKNYFNTVEIPGVRRLTISQQKTVTEMSGLGTSEWLNNGIFLQSGERFTLGIEGGLAIQNTVINPWIPNYQYTLGVSVSFAINDNLDGYFFGRYISEPFNKPDDYFDPFMYNNPLFLQSGTGAGLKSNIKNKIVDFQIMSGYDHQLKNMNNFNSKLQIKF